MPKFAPLANVIVDTAAIASCEMDIDLVLILRIEFQTGVAFIPTELHPQVATDLPGVIADLWHTV
jgi:hypothetical protein